MRTNVFYFYRELLMRYARWDIPDKGPEIPPELLRAGCTPLLAALLALKGLDTPEAALSFLDGGEEALGDPMLLPDMPAATARRHRGRWAAAP